ncbi:hypothetical protein N2152v2_003877 [Parachlorella kessleri]
MEASEAAPPAGPAFGEGTHGEADDFAPPGLLIKPSQPFPKQPLGEPDNFAQQVEDAIVAFLRTKPNNTEHLSKIGVLLRQRRLLPEGKLKFFLDACCPRLVVDGEPAGSQYISLATTTTREGQQGGAAAGEGAQQAQHAGPAGSRPASAPGPGPQRPAKMDRPQSAVSAGPADPDDIDEDWLESMLVNHMRSQPTGAMTGPILGDFCIKQLGFSMRGRLHRFLQSRPHVFRLANDGRQTVLLVEQRGPIGNGGVQQGAADRARQPGQQQAQQQQHQLQQGSHPPSLAPPEGSTLPGGTPIGPDASNVATSVLPGAAAAARETRSFTKWDPLTQEVFQFVRSRGVATFQQIDTHMRNNYKHLISGAGVPPHAWKSQIFLGKRRNIFRLQGPVVSLVSHVPGEEAAADAPNSAGGGAGAAGGAHSSPPDRSPPPLAQPSNAVSAGAASPAGPSAAGRSSEAADAAGGGAQAAAVPGHNPVLDAFIAERKALEELRDDIQHKLASFKALSELQKENAGLRAACVTLGRELLSMKQDFTLFRDQMVQVLGGEGGPLSMLPGPAGAGASSDLAASHAELQRAGSAGVAQQQQQPQQLQPQGSPMQQSHVHQPPQQRQQGQPPLANGSLAAPRTPPLPLGGVPAGLGTSPQLQKAPESSATGQGAVAAAPAVLPSQEGGILLVGGHDGVSWLDSADFFCPAKSAWSSLPILDQPRSFAVAVATPADIFVAGGGNGMDWYNTVVRCERYQAFAGSGSWQALSPMNVARGSLAGAVSCSRLYCYGGGKPKEQYNVVEWYDPGNDRWFIGPALSSRRFALGGAAIDSALYAVGGYDGETYLNTVERLDPREGRWGVLPGEMASKRGGHACVAAGGYLYALGGFDSLQAIPHCEVFDPRMNAWSPIGDMSDSRAYGSAAAVGGQVYALGGLQSDMETHSVLVERYDSASNSWQHVALPSNANPRRSFLAACGLE